MKQATIKLTAPKVGRGGEDGILDLVVREAESWEDAITLSGGDEAGSLELFNGAYNVKLQNNFRGDMKSDGSSDESIRKLAADFIYERGRKPGGLTRSKAESNVLAKARAAGKTSISLTELDAAIEEELELAALEEAEEAEATA